VRLKHGWITILKFLFVQVVEIAPDLFGIERQNNSATFK